MRSILLAIVVFVFAFTSPTLAAKRDAPPAPHDTKVCTQEYAEVTVEKWHALGDDEGVWPIYKCSYCGRETKGVPHGSTFFCQWCGAAHSKEPVIEPVTRKIEGGNGQIEVDARFMVSPEERETAAQKLWACRSCGAGNFTNFDFCACGAPKPDANQLKQVEIEIAQANPPPPVPAPPSSSGSHMGTVAALGSVAAIAAGGGIYWAVHKRSVEGHVSSLTWKHEITTERYTRVKAENWENNISKADARMPVGGVGERAGAFNVRDCRLREDASDTYVCGHHPGKEKIGSHEVGTGRKNCGLVPSEKKNGTFVNKCTPITRTVNDYKDVSVPDYCPKKKNWCAYDTYEWRFLDHAEKTGENPSGGPLPWPDVQPGDLDRTRKSESYHIEYTFEDKGKHQTIGRDLPSESEFLTWKAGQGVEFKTNNVGQIFDMTRK